MAVRKRRGGGSGSGGRGGGQQRQQQQREATSNGNHPSDGSSSPSSSSSDKDKTKTMKRGSNSTAMNRKTIVGCVLVVVVAAMIAVVVVVVTTNQGEDIKTATPSQQQQEQQESSTSSPSPEPALASTTDAAPPSPPPTTTPTPPIQIDRLTSYNGTYEVLETAPHDPDAFTQGLCIVYPPSTKGDDGALVHPDPILYEGTGLYGGKSHVRIVDLYTGQVLKRHVMDTRYFGEGLSHYYDPNDQSAGGGKLIQLTWKERTGFVYDAVTLEPISEFSYDTSNRQGWGITTVYADGAEKEEGSDPYFIVTDGSENLMFWSSDSERLGAETKPRVPVYRTVTVATNRGQATVTIRNETVNLLNEIEWDLYQPSTIYANVWYQDLILRVDYTTGFVTKVYNVSQLVEQHFTSHQHTTEPDVFNGIALTDQPNVVWVTGKLWSQMYKIRLID